jgi:hypothetical protein
MSKSRVLMRAMGMEYLVAATFMTSLAFGVNAVTAAGLGFAVGALLDVVSFVVSSKPPWAEDDDIDDDNDDDDASPPLPPRPQMRALAQMVNIVLKLIFAAGFLVPFKK